MGKLFQPHVSGIADSETCLHMFLHTLYTQAHSHLMSRPVTQSQ